MRVLYIDEFLITNLAINFVLLYVTKRVLRYKTSNLRIFLGSFLGAGYALFLYFPRFGMLVSIFGKISFSLLLILVTYKVISLKEYLKTVFVFYLVCFVFGGCGYAINNLIFSDYNIIFSVKILFVSTVLAYIAINSASAIYKKFCARKNYYTNINVELGGKTAEILGLIDTGNSLCDYLSNLPVIIVEFEQVKCLLPEDITYAFNNSFEVIYKAAKRSGFKNRLRLIPYNSIGNSDGIIIGFIPDKVLIEGKPVDVIIGISKNKVSADRSYFALVNPQVFI